MFPLVGKVTKCCSSESSATSHSEERHLGNYFNFRTQIDLKLDKILAADRQSRAPPLHMLYDTVSMSFMHYVICFVFHLEYSNHVKIFTI